MGKCKSNKCDGYHLLCNCQIKAPKMEVRFLVDQRSQRNMQIVGVDSVVTDKWRRAEERELAEALQRNAFFAHSDQLLLAMCADSDELIRRKAVKLIRNLRDQILEEEEENTENDSECEVDNDLIQYTDDDTDKEENEEYLGFQLEERIRDVHVPALRWQAKSYHTMIDWTDSLESEPPYIAHFSDQDVVNILDRPLQVPRWINNTQAVERGIKAVTEACTAVTGHLERDGYIKQRMHSRKLMPKFNTKRDFNHNI